MQASPRLFAEEVNVRFVEKKAGFFLLNCKFQAFQKELCKKMPKSVLTALKQFMKFI